MKFMLIVPADVHVIQRIYFEGNIILYKTFSIHQKNLFIVYDYYISIALVTTLLSMPNRIICA